MTAEKSVIASQVGKADSYFVRRWSVFATHENLLGIVTGHKKAFPLRGRWHGASRDG